MNVFAVHIVTHNSAETILYCLQSLAAQTFTDYQLIVIDNASTDTTHQQLTSANVTPICNRANVGYAAAHNQALALSDSRYVLTLNPDVWLHPDFLQQAYDALETHPQVGAVAGCLLRTDDLTTAPTRIDGKGLFMTTHRQQRLRDENQPMTPSDTIPQQIWGPDGAAAVYRREMLNDIAYEGEVFDSDFFIHKEDVDVCWRAQWRGWQALYVPNAIAHHVRGFRPGQRDSMNWRIKYFAVRNRYLLMLKNDDLGHLLADSLLILSYEVLILGYLILREPTSLAAYWGVLRLLPRMLKKRRYIWQHRRVTAADMRQWFQPTPTPKPTATPHHLSVK